MGRDGTATRERLLDAAQHLFARRGFEAVPIREINALAGQRNASALHYHFGSRRGLLVAVIERRQETIDAERRRLLETAVTTRDIVAAVVIPFAAELRTAGGRDYLRIFPAVLGAGHDESDLPIPAGLADAMDRLDKTLSHLDPAARRLRHRAMALLMTTLLADRASRIESGPRPSLAHDDFVREVVSMLLGVLTEAPA